MRYLIVLRGLPASGKDFFIKENNLESYTLSSDKYRLLLSSFSPRLNSEFNGINQNYDSQAWKRLYEDLEFRMKHGEFTIVNATHMTKKSIERYRKLCKMYYYRMVIVNFDADVETCISRDLGRGVYSVGADVIRHMAEKKENLSKSIKQICTSEFHTFIESVYQPISLDKYNNIHVIGDIHGCYCALNDFVSDKDFTNDAFIFVGDYFDRGIENFFVYNFIQKYMRLDNFFFIKGNHEQRIIEYLNGEENKTQFLTKTLPELQRNNVTDKDLRNLIYNLYSFVFFTYRGKYYLVSHGGVTKVTYVHPFMSEDIFVRGVGNYEDMEKVCEYWESHNNAVQIFGHRNNNDVPIKINSKCYNVCGFPEYGGDLKAVTINEEGIKEHYIQNKIFNKEGYYKAISKYPDRYEVTDVETLVGVFRYNKYVKETEFGDISSFQFTKDAFYEGNWGKIINRARGLFINTRTNKIVARSYDKFFLLGQYEYCTLDKFEPPFTIYKKYDGFLGIIGYDEESDSILYCSKSTLAPWGDYANLFKSKIEPLIKDEEALKNFLRYNNCSLVFECIAPKEDEHIIKYDKDRVILLDIILNNINFLSYEYEGVVWNQSKIFFNGIESKSRLCTVSKLLEYIDVLKDKGSGEGWVIEDKNGDMFKLKTYTYEVEKILRNIKDIYTKIKEQAGEHEIKCPSEDKIRLRYRKYYSKKVIDEVIRRVPDIIKEINSR